MATLHVVWLLISLGNIKETIGVISVSLENKGLTSIPGDLRSDVGIIKFGSNKISTIKREDFNDKYPKLEELSFTHNQIRSIEYGCFRETRISKLLFGSNLLTTIPDLRQVKTTLTILDFNNNEIARVSNDVLEYLVYLRELNLGENPVATLSDMTKILPSLNSLDVEGIPLECCNTATWMKRAPGVNLVLTLSTYPCESPLHWASFKWAQITEAMLQKQSCPVTIVESRRNIRRYHRR
ncbi:hypothetical protein CAPTEDRAFT_201177 [Capitella teleta]|uniref:LRRCT domain-containing protein n=1 Tax=Capitella teleta TaxID=283909 RepID=R7TR78_CAPTE|nr:hypothetical protein CAPTEDRAFT_201177 [Capitella teleta]|eukprot:ELT96082.1 hypothetical protein CAPTEDRAFT_201177 [Capitella teleta]